MTVEQLGCLAKDVIDSHNVRGIRDGSIIATIITTHMPRNEAAARLADKARRARLATLSLVAVSDSTRFWRRRRFCAVVDAGLAATLASYGSTSRYMVRDV